MATVARRPAAASRIHIQAILDALADAGSPGAVTPQVLERTEHRALRRPRQVFTQGPAVYPLGPLRWFWDSSAARTVRPAGLTVEGGLLVCLPDAGSTQRPNRWRPVHRDVTATTAADLDAIVECLERLAAAHAVTLPADRPYPAEWTGDGTAAPEPSWA